MLCSAQLGVCLLSFSSHLCSRPQDLPSLAALTGVKLCSVFRLPPPPPRSFSLVGREQDAGPAAGMPAKAELRSLGNPLVSVMIKVDQCGVQQATALRKSTGWFPEPEGRQGPQGQREDSKAVREQPALVAATGQGQSCLSKVSARDTEDPLSTSKRGLWTSIEAPF